MGKQKNGDVERDLGKARKKGLKKFEVKDWTFMFIQRPGVYSRDTRREGLFHASVQKKRFVSEGKGDVRNDASDL